MMKKSSEKDNHLFYPEVLIYCGAGYTFDEVYKPIIEANCDKWRIYLVMADFYLAETVIQKVNRLVSQGKIVSWEIVPVLEKGLSLSLKYYKKLFPIITALKNKEFDLLLLTNDFYPTDRYLIEIVKSKKGKVVVISTGTIWRVLAEYRRMKGKNPTYYTVLVSKFKQLSQYNGFLNKVIILSKYLKNRLINSLIRLPERKLRYCYDHYFMPFILIGKPLPGNIYDKFTFTSGRADAVILYDEEEIKAVKTVIPTVKNLFFARHPSTNTCKCSGDSVSKNGKAMLVCFNGNVSTELQGENFERWASTVKLAVELTDIKEISVRFHPRTSEKLTWPDRFLDRIKTFNCNVSVSNPMEESLPDIICKYAGVIGGPSGSLRVARALCNKLFIVGLPNSGDGSPDDQDWILGDARGINWIRNGEKLETQHINIPEMTTNNIPTITAVLDYFLADTPTLLHIDK